MDLFFLGAIRWEVGGEYPSGAGPQPNPNGLRTAEARRNAETTYRLHSLPFFAPLRFKICQNPLKKEGVD